MPTRLCVVVRRQGCKHYDPHSGTIAQLLPWSVSLSVICCVILFSFSPFVFRYILALWLDAAVLQQPALALLDWAEMACYRSVNP